MKTILLNLQKELSQIEGLFIDENWGQLDYYSPNMPVQWPCCLIDVNGAEYSNMGVDANKTPVNRQNAQVVAQITIANMKLTNTSFNAPQGQKDNAWSIWDLIENIHCKLHGFNPSDTSGRMIRKSLQRTQRDDGVQEYEVTYAFEIRNV
ncbi:hypothetical protein B0A56_00775 [Flavobacterium columnare NBRC 100251 = ATCC 23463]|nr:hypothetical protein B0A56_00775 [Flavobacterium columnare NBRC 100251 = ATCC 23463]